VDWITRENCLHGNESKACAKKGKVPSLRFELKNSAILQILLSFVFPRGSPDFNFVTSEETLGEAKDPSVYDNYRDNSDLIN
jgi:hypothetical protein